LTSRRWQRRLTNALFDTHVGRVLGRYFISLSLSAVWRCQSVDIVALNSDAEKCPEKQENIAFQNVVPLIFMGPCLAKQSQHSIHPAVPTGMEVLPQTLP